MLKAADVLLVGYEKTGGGHCTAIVRGGIANVRMAVDAGVEAAQASGQTVSSSADLLDRCPTWRRCCPSVPVGTELRREGGSQAGQSGHWPTRDAGLSGDGGGRRCHDQECRCGADVPRDDWRWSLHDFDSGVAAQCGDRDRSGHARSRAHRRTPRGHGHPPPARRPDRVAARPGAGSRNNPNRCAFPSIWRSSRRRPKPSRC